jgi:hypothetical protein
MTSLEQMIVGIAMAAGDRDGVVEQRLSAPYPAT